MEENNKVFCGNEKVSMQEKSSFVDNIFSSVHKNYDLMNDIMSFGMHHLWKEKFVEIMNQCLMFKENGILLDIASGTGDIAIKFLSQKQKSLNHQIIISDFNKDMLSIAREKIVNKNLIENVDFMIIDATEIPLQDSSVDLYTISFGIRNVANLQKALDEAYRVLKPNSYFLCMEFSPIQNKKTCFSKIYSMYSKIFIPFFGKIVARDKNAYQYLIDSINTFPDKDDFAEMIKKSGFKNVKYIELNQGLVAIHIGKK